MAITFDAQGSVTGSSVANLTTAAFTIAGSDRVLIAAMGGLRIAGNPTHNVMKWEGSSGASLTQIGSTISVSNLYTLSLWRLIAPNAASGTLYGEFSGTMDFCWIGGCSYTGVDQTTPVGASNTASAANQASPATSSVAVSSATDELVVAASMAGTSAGGGTSLTVAVGAGQTQRWERETIDGNGAATMSDEAGAASVTMTEVFTCNVNVDWLTFGAPLKPVGAAAAVFPPDDGWMPVLGLA